MLYSYHCQSDDISIHALREEGDSAVSVTPAQFNVFLSTPSARRATTYLFRLFHRLLLFLSTPSARRATWLPLVWCPCVGISIHALREEGDGYPAQCISSRLHFYPRPPRGGRPAYLSIGDGTGTISIHALREEGDVGYPDLSRPTYRFLSTPSARRATQCSQSRRHGTKKFLSTPSARRATAKTERKHPAFVSLYTSLHKLQRDACKTNRKITPLLAQTAGIPVRSVPENHVCCRFALAGHQKISTLSWANSGCSPTCSTLVW